MKKIVGSLSALALISIGCVAEREVEGYSASETVYVVDGAGLQGSTAAMFDVFSGNMAGDMGPVRGFAGTASPNGYIDPGYASLDLTTTTSQGTAMHILNINGGLEHPELAPGLSATYDPDEYPSEGELHIMSTNCSTQGEPGNWDYDTTADEVKVDVSETEDPEIIRVDYETTTEDYTYGTDVSTGSFLLRR